jgi:hypothetical protein
VLSRRLSLQMPLSAVLALAAAEAGAAENGKESERVWPEITEKDTEVVRIFNGPDGKSTHGKARLDLWKDLKAKEVKVGWLPKNTKLGWHAPTVRHVVVPIKGTNTMILGDGSRLSVSPGLIILVEDVGGAGHAGEIGPDGYLGIDILLAT